MDRVKVYGEVFTPITLVIELLDKLPSEVWTNPDLTWFEPSAGRGVFMDEIFSRLIKHHSKEHILNNMLFMAELQADNCEILRQTYPNVYEGNTLKMKLPMFDIVIGNPPFNSNAPNQAGTTAGRGTLWDKFIIQAIDILNPDGYLCFINPAGWRGPGKQHNIWDLLTTKQIVYLHIYGVKDGQNYFNAGTRFDIYVVQNKPVATDTIVIDELNEQHKFRLDKLPFLPNYAYDIILPILVLDGIDVIRDCAYHAGRTPPLSISQKTTEYKYPVIHSINKKGIYPLRWSNTNTRGHYGVPKVILNANGVQYNWEEQNDWEGKYGMTQLSFGIPITSKEEGDMILQAIKTDKFKTLIKATVWSMFQTDYRMFKYFKKDMWGGF